MSDKRLTIQDYEKQRRFSIKLRLIAVAVSCLVIVGAGVCFKHQAGVRERLRLEAEENNRRIAAEKAEAERLAAHERMRQRQIEDSIRIANMPAYTIYDVHKMARTQAPSYSWVYLWRKDNDNWIMSYKKEYGDKEHWFMQRFNPTSRKFEKPIEYSIIYYKNLADDRAVYIRPNNVRCSFTKDEVRGILDYYEDGKYMGEYNRKGIEDACRLPSQGHGQLGRKRIKALDAALPEWAEDGYESAEDYYYDNEEDLYLFYGR